MTKEELMLLVRKSYPGDAIRECISEDGELLPYVENVGDGLAVFVANEIGGALEDEWMLQSAMEMVDAAIEDLMSVRASIDVALAVDALAVDDCVLSLEEAAGNCTEAREELARALGLSPEVLITRVGP